jgi:hypothetical protein
VAVSVLAAVVVVADLAVSNRLIAPGLEPQTQQ